MSPDKLIIERTVYSVGDWLNELGGFMQAIEWVFLLVLPMV
jgi:hypothetical protein